MFKRYKPFFRAGAIELLSYKFNLFTWLIVSSLQVICIVFLWIAIYQNSSDGYNSVINGFSFPEMISYLVMINIFSFVSFDGTTLWTINDEIRNGTIAMSFTKPISYRVRLLATTLGATSMQFILFGIPCFSLAYIIFILLGFIEVTSMFIIYLLLFFVARLIAILILDSIHYIFGVLCFYTSSGYGINQIKDVIIAFLSGTLIPLSFFPGVFENIVNCLPFSSIAQTPILIMLMKVDIIDAVILILKGIIWLVVLEVFAKVLFNHASKKITVQGG